MCLVRISLQLGVAKGVHHQVHAVTSVVQSYRWGGSQRHKLGIRAYVRVPLVHDCFSVKRSAHHVTRFYLRVWREPV